MSMVESSPVTCGSFPAGRPAGMAPVTDGLAPGAIDRETLDSDGLRAILPEAPTEALEFAHQLVSTCLEQAALALEAIRSAIERRDVKCLAATAHSNKGGFLSVGAGRLASTCRELELAAKSADWSQADQLVQRLPAEITAFTGALAKFLDSSGLCDDGVPVERPQFTQRGLE